MRSARKVRQEGASGGADKILDMIMNQEDVYVLSRTPPRALCVLKTTGNFAT
jgi:hypothetical protein